VSTIKIGATVAAVVAGPKLYALVQTGDLSASAALTRGAGVVAACALGAFGIRRIIAGYEREANAATVAAERAAGSTPAAGGERVALEGTPLGPLDS
jgi:hypothetical protein